MLLLAAMARAQCDGSVEPSVYETASYSYSQSFDMNGVDDPYLEFPPYTSSPDCPVTYGLGVTPGTF